MNKKKLVELRYKHVRLVPPALQLTRDGTWIRIDWEWCVQAVSEHGIALNGNGGWGGDVGLDDIHSYQSGKLLLWGQLRVFRGGRVRTSSRSMCERVRTRRSATKRVDSALLVGFLETRFPDSRTSDGITSTSGLDSIGPVN